MRPRGGIVIATSHLAIQNFVYYLRTLAIKAALFTPWQELSIIGLRDRGGLITRYLFPFLPTSWFLRYEVHFRRQTVFRIPFLNSQAESPLFLIWLAYLKRMQGKNGKNRTHLQLHSAIEREILSRGFDFWSERKKLPLSHCLDLAQLKGYAWLINIAHLGHHAPTLNVWMGFETTIIVSRIALSTDRVGRKSKYGK